MYFETLKKKKQFETGYRRDNPFNNEHGRSSPFASFPIKFFSIGLLPSSFFAQTLQWIVIYILAVSQGTFTLVRYVLQVLDISDLSSDLTEGQTIVCDTCTAIRNLI